MEKSKLLDRALELIMGDLDDIEGKAATMHTLEECPDPAHCTMHDKELGDSLTEEGKPEAVSVEVKKLEGMPTLAGERLREEEGAPAEGKSNELTPEEAEELRKLIGKAV